jgi:hypothetical protein
MYGNVSCGSFVVCLFCYIFWSENPSLTQKSWFQQNFVEKVGDYIADICYLACKHKVKLEPSFINASLAVEIMEGYVCVCTGKQFLL